MSIADHIAAVREKIAEEAIRAGRSPEEIALMAVTKTRSVPEILAAKECGISLMGENKAQEITEKYPYLKDQMEIHFIGHLQTNKINAVIDKADMIESLDSLHLAQALEKKAAERGRTVDVLMQINTGKEEQKTGFFFEQAEEAVRLISEYSHLRLRGFMAVAPRDFGKKTETERIFAKMFDLFIDIKEKMTDNRYIDLLSMGMSHDYDLAVRHGANIVRVGSAIFGERNY